MLSCKANAPLQHCPDSPFCFGPIHQRMTQQHQLEAPKPINYQAAESCKTVNNPSQHPTSPSPPPNSKYSCQASRYLPLRSNHSVAEHTNHSLYSQVIRAGGISFRSAQSCF
ncbi:hypothetical protein BYT27DRAFT_7202966 [Phlegmacium glaucopus]|nr:hypothetical protein BYT27DRAFT_7202966 [Phlegmacium glaucopus]